MNFCLLKLEFWNKYRQVPENALKPFDNGKFKGTDINTMWRMKCLTEEFGMCGIGWYYEIERLWTETTQENEIFAFAEIKLYIKVDNEWSKGISGTGGNKLARTTSGGKVSTSDEAYKMAVTDAFGVACRNLGIGADVNWENDKTKYTQEQEPLNEELVKEAGRLGILLGKVATYYKKSVDTLTNEELSEAIKMKKGNAGK